MKNIMELASEINRGEGLFLINFSSTFINKDGNLVSSDSGIIYSDDQQILEMYSEVQTFKIESNGELTIIESESTF